MAGKVSETSETPQEPPLILYLKSTYTHMSRGHWHMAGRQLLRAPHAHVHVRRAVRAGLYNPFTCVLAMERANDVTRSYLDLRLLPALPVAWLPPRQRHSPQVSCQPIQISVFLKIEAARPIYGYVESPDFTATTSSPP